MVVGGMRGCSRGGCVVAPGGDMRGCSQGACMVAPRGACMVAPGGQHGCSWGVGMAKGGMCGEGGRACMVRGACVVKGACVAKGGMHGEGACVVKGGVCGKGGMCGKGGACVQRGASVVCTAGITRAVRILLECILVAIVTIHSIVVASPAVLERRPASLCGIKGGPGGWDTRDNGCDQHIKNSCAFRMVSKPVITLQSGLLV